MFINFFTFLQRVYAATSRQLRRMESISRSPIYNHFFETMNGVSTIRAYSQQQRFIQENFFKVDENQVAHYPIMISYRWVHNFTYSTTKVKRAFWLVNFASTICPWVHADVCLQTSRALIWCDMTQESTTTSRVFTCFLDFSVNLKRYTSEKPFPHTFERL